MTRKENYRKWLIRIMVATLIFFMFFAYYYINRMVPGHIHLVLGEADEFNFQLPVAATLRTESKEVMLGKESNIPAEEIRVTLNQDFTMQSLTCGKYTVSLDLFGWFHFKDIEVSVVEEGYVVPCGVPVGICLDTDGIMVVGTAQVTDETGKEVSPAEEVLRSGDYILSMNGEKVSTKEELADRVALCGGEEICLEIRRGGKIKTVFLIPAVTEDGTGKMGAWIRDDLHGIGTLTYIEEDGGFGTLGHCISDRDTGLMVESKQGLLYEAKINRVIKGSTGNAGSFVGSILYGEDLVWGTVAGNSQAGVFGEVEEVPERVKETEWIPIGYRQDVATGEALVRCTIDGVTQDYEIRILRCDPSDRTNKSLVIEVTDPELLEKTGGIVQGMSGSPIIQDGKLVGAVTHVLLSDSKRGYGIYLETMLEAAG